MNIIQSVVERIEDYYQENKKPCKSYKTEDAAIKAMTKYAEQAGKYFDQDGKPARFVVFFVPAMQRWAGALDYTELFSRRNAIGGYVGIIKGVFTY